MIFSSTGQHKTDREGAGGDRKDGIGEKRRKGKR